MIRARLLRIALLNAEILRQEGGSIYRGMGLPRLFKAKPGKYQP